MNWFFGIFIWICFIGLIVYTFYYAKDEAKMDKKVFLIRKVWYLLYALGGLIYWTTDMSSIFTDWKKYLIVFALFVCVDAFIFLNLYLRKAGNYEMDRLTKTVSQNDMFIEDNLTAAKNMLDFLNQTGIVGYYDDKEDYLLGLKQVLNDYSSKQDMSVELFPFSKDEEKQQILNLYENKGSIRSKLDRGETFYQNNHALQLIHGLENETILLKTTGNRAITEMDCTLLGILVMMYELVRPEQSDEMEGVTNDESDTDNTNS